jgi:tetratricopeptide (TPR) repeat protein
MSINVMNEMRGNTKLIASVTALLLPLLHGCAANSGTTAGEPRGVDLYVESIRLAEQGSDSEAIKKLEEATAQNPNLVMAQTRLGKAYLQRGSYRLAAERFEISAKLDQYTSSNHFNLGVAYQFLNRPQDAASAYQAALNLKPDDVKANMNLGLAYLASGETEMAVRYLRRATELDGANANAFANLAVALDAQGKAEEAESVYRRALELDSSSVTTMQNMAQNLIGQGKGEQALALMMQVIVRSDTPTTRVRLGEALAMTRQFDQAFAQYALVLKEDPHNIAALNARGNCHVLRYVAGLELANSDRLAAIDSWKQSLAINANQPKIIELIKRWENAGMFGR